MRFFLWNVFTLVTAGCLVKGQCPACYSELPSGWAIIGTFFALLWFLSVIGISVFTFVEDSDWLCNGCSPEEVADRLFSIMTTPKRFIARMKEHLSKKNKPPKPTSAVGE